MRFKIVYDKLNRLRVRTGNYTFTQKQACGIEEYLLRQKYVLSAEANFRTGSILVAYEKGTRQKVLTLLKGINRECLPDVDIPLTIQADEKFRNNLENMLIRKAVMNFIPMGIRQYIILFKAVRHILKGLSSLLEMKIDVAVLDATSITAAILSGKYSTAGSVMFLLGLSELMEDYTHQRTKLALSEHMALNVDHVWVDRDGESVLIPFKEVQLGDKVIVHAGSVIPFDGTVCDGDAMINQSTMTGESEPVNKTMSDSVFAGTTVESGNLTLKVDSLADNSRLSQIINLIDESENFKASIQSNAEKLADSIVPLSFLGFGLTWLLTRDIQRALSVLMVDFSCAIKLSTPISVISAMREASDYGATVKGGKYLEAFAAADTIVFDKTGTLTNASPKVIDVIPFNGYERDYVLRTAACLEEHFPHSVATAVVEKAKEENLNHSEEHAEVEYLVAHGIVTQLNGERAIIGSAHFVFEDEGVMCDDDQQALIDQKSMGNSSIFLALGGKLAAMIVIDDPIREEAPLIIQSLREAGIHRICMLTGDAEPAAKRVADALGLNMYVSQVLPEHKSEYVNALKANNHKVIMVGDGVNDTPALAAADVSVAMSDGSDIAREVADITLMNDRLSELVTIRKISEGLMKRISQNYRGIVGFNSALLVLGATGILPPTTTAFLHNSSTMLISAKSMTKIIKEES